MTFLRTLSIRNVAIATFTVLLIALAGCASPPITPEGNVGAHPAARWTMDPALQSRLLALDPEHISDRDVRDTLAKGPTPRIMLLHGGVYPVHLVMAPRGKASANYTTGVIAGPRA